MISYSKKKKFDKLFLVTEERKYLNYFKKSMKNRILHIDSFVSNKVNIFEDNPKKRRLHRYHIGKENIIVVATKTKLLALNGRPLICDTGDGELDDELTGYIKVTTGFNDHIMYAVGHQNLENTGALQNQEINK